MAITFNGIIFAASVLLTMVAAMLYATKTNRFDTRQLVLAAPWATVSGFVFARVFYVAFNAAEYETFREKLDLLDGGYALYGAFFGVLLALAAFCLLFLPLLDAISVGGVLGIAAGRWGNWINQECYGDVVTDARFFGFPFSVYIADYDSYCLALFWAESFFCLMIFALLLFTGRRYRGRDGAVSVHFFAFYSCIRIVLESMRGDSMFIGFVRISQVFAAATLLLLFVVFSVRLIRRAGFRWWYIPLYALYAGGLTTAFLAEFYMGSETRVRNLLLLALASVLMTAFTLFMYHRNAAARRGAKPAAGAA